MTDGRVVATAPSLLVLCQKISVCGRGNSRNEIYTVCGMRLYNVYYIYIYDDEEEEEQMAGRRNPTKVSLCGENNSRIYHQDDDKPE